MAGRLKMATPKKLDTSVFDKAVAKATQQLVNRLSAEYTSEISSDKWDWVDGRTRDNVDTGRLVQPNCAPRFRYRI